MTDIYIKIMGIMENNNHGKDDTEKIKNKSNAAINELDEYLKNILENSPQRIDIEEMRNLFNIALNNPTKKNFENAIKCLREAVNQKKVVSNEIKKNPGRVIGDD